MIGSSRHLKQRNAWACRASNGQTSSAMHGRQGFKCPNNAQIMMLCQLWGAYGRQESSTVCMMQQSAVHLQAEKSMLTASYAASCNLRCSRRAACLPCAAHQAAHTTPTAPLKPTPARGNAAAFCTQSPHNNSQSTPSRACYSRQRLVAAAQQCCESWVYTMDMMYASAAASPYRTAGTKHTLAQLRRPATRSMHSQAGGAAFRATAAACFTVEHGMAAAPCRLIQRPHSHAAAPHLHSAACS